MLFILFLIFDLACILLALILLFTGRARWARLAALLPLGFGLVSGIIAFIGHTSPFPAWRLVVVLIFAAAITALICLLTARLLLGLGPKDPAPPE